MPSSSRLRAAVGAVLVLAAGIVQVACGVLHCVEADGTSASAAPPCHRGDDPEGSMASHMPGEGDDEDCCRVVSLEPVTTANIAHVSPLVCVRLARPASIATLAGVRLAAHPFETAPPAMLGIASPVPLRI